MISVTAENIQQEGKLWRYDVQITNSATKEVFTRTFYTPNEPDDTWKTTHKNMFLAEVNQEAGFVANPLNEDRRDELGEELKLIIIESVKYARANKLTLDAQGYLAWYDTRFPNSIFDGQKVMQFVLKKLGKKSFDEIKDEFAVLKFEGLD